MKLTLVFLATVLLLHSYAQKPGKICLKKGSWNAELLINDQDKLPFDLLIEKGSEGYLLTVMNGEESIPLESPQIINDSVHVRFPYFNSELVFTVNSRKAISGYWQNFNKGNNYRIPFRSKRKKTSRFAFIDKKSDFFNSNGKWQVEFEPNTNSSYPAVGIFSQEAGSNTVRGTFLTETGDYRFLEGNTINDSLYLSCFDGSHAFLFKAKLDNDTLYGKFFSGKHWQSEWEGFRNQTVELTSPEKLTYLKDTNNFNFELQLLDGNTFNYPNASMEDKVIIIQIMGSWCPNCLDETIYYKSLYDKYHNEGLEIISVCYETGDSFEEYADNIQRLKDKLNLDFTFLIGGSAQKKIASEQFSMLNEIISFPTSIFIGRDGEVKRIHTGFNGPGTGVYYDKYVEKTNALIEYLLAH